LERQVRKAKRLAEGLQQPEAAKLWQGKVKEAQKELRDFIAAHPEELRRDPWWERTFGIAPSEKEKTQGLQMPSKSDIISQSPAVVPPSAAAPMPVETGKLTCILWDELIRRYLEIYQRR
jgi:hypothetical protein